MKELTYLDIQKALEDLNAEEKNKYFICECPECNRKEAYIYKDRLHIIQCNRENQCGERFLLRFEKKRSTPQKWLNKESKYIKLKSLQREKLSELTNLLRHFQYNIPSKTLENYRGLSRESTLPFIADLQHEKIVKKMFKVGAALFGKDYSESSFMLKRNIVFPIYGDDGNVDRILLRSDDNSLEPKEIQLIVNPSKKTRDFFVDLKEDSSIVVISESAIDGSSFCEIDPSCSTLALSGSRKTMSLCEFIKENIEEFRSKKFIVATDNDSAGEKAANQIIQCLNKLNLPNERFCFPEQIKDGNEFLNSNRGEFEKRYVDTVHWLNQDTLFYHGIKIHPIGFKKESDRIQVQFPEGIEVDSMIEEKIISQYRDSKNERNYYVINNEEPKIKYKKHSLIYGGVTIKNIEISRNEGEDPRIKLESNHSIFKNVNLSDEVTETILKQDEKQLQLFLLDKKITLMYEEIRIYPIMFENLDGNFHVKWPNGVHGGESLEKEIINRFFEKNDENESEYIECSVKQPKLIYERKNQTLNYGEIKINSIEVDRLPDGSQPLVFFPSENMGYWNIKASKNIISNIIHQDTVQINKSNTKGKDTCFEITI